MTVGFILEGGPSGPDKRVFEILAQQLRPGTEVICIPLGPKQNLVSQCGEVAATLLQKGCSCVIIVWDLYPAWGAHGAKPCLKKDRRAIQATLAGSGINTPNVHLVCIHKMLESWLLADERAVSAAVSKLAKKSIPVPRIRRPEDSIKPKNVLRKIFGTYQAHTHAEAIISEISDFKRLNACKSFSYFHGKLAAC